MGTVTGNRKDWLKIFNEIDLNKDEPRKFKLLVNPTKEEYYKSHEKVVIQRLKRFKEETEMLSNDAKINFINEKLEYTKTSFPKMPRTEDEGFNQVVYECYTQFIIFLKQYKDYLTDEKITEPTTAVKALIFYIKYRNQLNGLSVKRKIEKASEVENWTGSSNSLKNMFDAIGKKTKKDPLSIENLNKALDILNIKGKDRAQFIKELQPDK